MSALQRLLQDLGNELQSEEVDFGNVAKASQAKAAEVRTVFNPVIQREVPLIICLLAVCPTDSRVGHRGETHCRVFRLILVEAAAKQDRPAQICCRKAPD